MSRCGTAALAALLPSLLLRLKGDGREEGKQGAQEAMHEVQEVGKEVQEGGKEVQEVVKEVQKAESLAQDS